MKRRKGNIVVKFILNEYHRNISDEDFIEDVIETAKKLNKATITTEEYDIHGKYHSSTLIRRFSSWKKVLELSLLETKGHNFKFNYSDEEIVADLLRVASIYKKSTLTNKEYSKYGKCHAGTLIRHYGTWNTVLELAGLKSVLNRNFNNEDLFEEIERVWTLLGRQPTATDIKNGVSKYSLNSYVRRFGGWRAALQAFVDFIYEDKEHEDFVNVDNESEAEQIGTNGKIKKDTSISQQHIS